MNSKIIAEAQAEQNHGRQKYGTGPDDFEHDDLHTTADWEEFIEKKLVLAALDCSGRDWRHAMVQIIGLAASAVESFDRKNGQWI